MPNVLVTRQLPGDAVSRLRGVATVDVWREDIEPPYDELVRRGAGAHGIVCLLTDRIDATLIASARGLRVISNMAVGYDNIDVQAATSRAIPVGNTPGALTQTTADLAFALILATSRRLTEAERFLREGGWKTWHPSLLLGHDVHGATLGVIGFGKIGQAVAARAAGFGMRVLFSSRSRVHSNLGEQVDLEVLLREADIVTLHVPLAPDTRHMIGARELALMKRTAVLINTSRGAVIDQEALVEALHRGTIAAAGLDVMETEPLSQDDPLLRAPNVVLLPHIGSASHATRERMAAMAVDNCIAGLRGERLPNCVNPEIYG